MPTKKDLEKKQELKEKPVESKVPTPLVSSESEADLFKEESDYLSDDVYQSDESDDSLKTYNNDLKKKNRKVYKNMSPNLLTISSAYTYVV